MLPSWLSSLLVLCICCQCGYSSHLLDSSNAAAVQTRPNDAVEKVHIVFMNHLDVGYADLVNDIINEYFQKYFTLASTTWKALKDGGYVETFIYTTHPWLVSMYLDCPPNFVLFGVKLQCPNDTQKAEFIDAVNKGIITWHAGPMNLEMEMAQDAWMVEFGVELSKSLDKRFGIERSTLVLSQRDVPGMTQAVIPSLVKKGVTGITVGVNNMTPPPAVPQLFVWQFGTDSVLGTWHPGGYPDNPGSDPAHPGGLSKKDCVVVDGLSEALCFAFRTDNSGPPRSAAEVLGFYEILRAEFPNAKLQASRLEDFFEVAQKIKDKLPVITNEIGDTWIEGVASDPKRCAEYRAVSRVMRDCFIAGECSLSDPRVWNSSVFLLKNPEHTWGFYTEGDVVNWANDKFHPIQYSKPSFIVAAASWTEQRQFVYTAIEALRDHPVVAKISHELSQLTAQLPQLNDFRLASNPSNIFSCGKMNLGFGVDGSIVHLEYHGKTFVSKNFPLSRFVYVTYNETDFDAFGKVYNYNGYSAGYYKSNLTANFDAHSQQWDAKLTALYVSKASECEFYAEVKSSDIQTHTLYGAPETVWFHYVVDSDGIDIDVQLFNKTSTRLPEAIFVAFQLDPSPGVDSRTQWQMSKLSGKMIDPYNVLLNGSQYHHVLDDGGATHVATGIRFASRDIPITCPITSSRPISAFPTPLSPITDDITGFAFNIYNNIWATNYIMWYPYLPDDANFKARFRVDLSKVVVHHHEHRERNSELFDRL